jgi:hypothetical protein
MLSAPVPVIPPREDLVDDATGDYSDTDSLVAHSGYSDAEEGDTKVIHEPEDAKPSPQKLENDLVISSWHIASI